MRLPATRPARFLARPNRFVVEAEVEGRAVRAYCANPGRLRELLVPGTPLRVRRRAAPAPRPGVAPPTTTHDAVLARDGRTWVGLDTRLASGLFAEGAAAGRLPGFRGRLEAEVPVGRSRLDFRLHGRWPALVEVKCASLVVDGVARFPDAPSERATRHARVLASHARRGNRASLVFIIVRPDAEAFAPLEDVDPHFAAALRRAHRAGVEVRAFRCATTPREVRVQDEVPVHLGT